MGVSVRVWWEKVVELQRMVCATFSKDEKELSIVIQRRVPSSKNSD